MNPIAQEYDHCKVIMDDLEPDKAKVCYCDSYDNICGLVCVMPREKDWPGSIENAHFIVKMFNERKGK